MKNSELKRRIRADIEAEMDKIKRKSDPFSNGVYAGLNEALAIVGRAKEEG